uniref:Uncharacterized protein n=1 Tax=Oryza nivara TaxID=4536 RepID=A0A0E0HZC6_ORYNI
MPRWSTPPRCSPSPPPTSAPSASLPARRPTSTTSPAGSRPGSSRSPPWPQRTRRRQRQGEERRRVDGPHVARRPRLARRCAGSSWPRTRTASPPRTPCSPRRPPCRRLGKDLMATSRPVRRSPPDSPAPLLSPHSTAAHLRACGLCNGGRRQSPADAVVPRCLPKREE